MLLDCLHAFAVRSCTRLVICLFIRICELKIQWVNVPVQHTLTQTHTHTHTIIFTHPHPHTLSYSHTHIHTHSQQVFPHCYQGSQVQTQASTLQWLKSTFNRTVNLVWPTPSSIVAVRTSSIYKQKKAMPLNASKRRATADCLNYRGRSTNSL